jgi:hypothetical protein
MTDISNWGSELADGIDEDAVVMSKAGLLEEMIARELPIHCTWNTDRQ